MDLRFNYLLKNCWFVINKIIFSIILYDLNKNNKLTNKILISLFTFYNIKIKIFQHIVKSQYSATYHIALMGCEYNMATTLAESPHYNQSKLGLNLNF